MESPQRVGLVRLPDLERKARPRVFSGARPNNPQEPLKTSEFMKPFLQELAEKLYGQYKNNLSSLKIIFPNRRAGLFFRQHLAEVIDAPIWAPEILSIEDFFRSLSVTQPADRLTLIFELYQAYKKLNPHYESFDRFYSWGDMLLRDFDEIDKYLADAKNLFLSLKDQKELENQFDYLTDEQKDFIRSFWNSFGARESKQQKDFLKIWAMLYQLYASFKVQLKQKGIGYDGMIFREVVEQLHDNPMVFNERVVFVGFNVLTKVEEKLLGWFYAQEKGDIFWDADAFYMENERQEAGSFLRKYQKHKVLGKSFPKAFPKLLEENLARKIEIIGVPLQVGQAKKVGERLELLMREKIDDWSPKKTVVVLPDEQLLFPMLHSLPPELGPINVTMGYPLKNTLIYSLLEHLLDLQITAKRSSQNKVVFYHEKVLAILKHPYVFQYGPEAATENIRQIEQENRVYISSERLAGGNVLYMMLFRFMQKAEEVPGYLIEVLLRMNAILHKEGQGQGGLEQEYIFQVYTQVNRLQEVFREQEIELTLNIFLKLFRQIIQSLRLPFTGEPLDGLQIMGSLETRNLDFENVFILSMNEGAYPSQASNSSYIPFNIRRGFGLPTIDQQDAIYAYNFYRLLQRANRVFLFYNTEDSADVKGEMSRFLYQLMYEPGFNVSRQMLSNPVQIKQRLPITIHKSKEVMDKLEKYVIKDSDKQHRLTPSALNIYLDCRLKFYYRYIAGLYETEKVQELVDPQVFGNLLHHAMEIIYADEILGKGQGMVEATDFENISVKVEAAVEKAFNRHYALEEAEHFSFQGRNIIVKEVIKKYALKVLEIDKDYAPFEIVGLEASGEDVFTLDLNISKNGALAQVGFKGIIDRIDKKGDVVRVIDYKTGVDTAKVENISSLFDRNAKGRNKAAMQTIFYGLLYQARFPENASPIMPGILSTKSLFTDLFDIRLSLKDAGHGLINDIRPFLPFFKESLQNLVEEIYDEAIPFDQTEDENKCSYCPFKGICVRGDN